MLSEDGEQLTHQYDAMANTNALLDDSGVLQANYKYYAFGQVSSFSVEGDYWASLSVDQWWNLTVDQWWGLPAQLTTHMLAGGSLCVRGPSRPSFEQVQQRALRHWTLGERAAFHLR